MRMQIDDNKTIIHLAPMEGVVDFVLRDILTSQGGIDLCVTEFIRVTDKLHSPAVIYKYAPELKMGSKTLTGTPLHVQFLGGQPDPLAENANQAAELGALGIDLNFGCPAKTVNRHDGGAALLKSADRIYKIVSAVRKSVPKHIPVTAKMRLGFDQPDACIENAQAIAAGGAHWVTVHCRTKTDGYRPPAYWDWIPRIKAAVNLPVVSNGEIWTLNDFIRCREICQTERVMIGRGLVANPYLANKIKNYLSKDSNTFPTQKEYMSTSDKKDFQNQILEEDSQTDNQKNSFVNSEDWTQTLQLLPHFFKACTFDKSAFFAQARTKQWLKAISLRQEAARPLFEELKVLTDPHEFEKLLIKRVDSTIG